MTLRNALFDVSNERIKEFGEKIYFYYRDGGQSVYYAEYTRRMRLVGQYCSYHEAMLVYFLLGVDVVIVCPDGGIFQADEEMTNKIGMKSILNEDHNTIYMFLHKMGKPLEIRKEYDETPTDFYDHFMYLVPCDHLDSAYRIPAAEEDVDEEYETDANQHSHPENSEEDVDEESETDANQHSNPENSPEQPKEKKRKMESNFIGTMKLEKKMLSMKKNLIKNLPAGHGYPHH